MKITRKTKCLIVSLTFTLASGLIAVQTGHQAFANDDSGSEATFIELPQGYASDSWLTSGDSNWEEEKIRREDELYNFLSDTDLNRAKAYMFDEGHTPALAWNWFDQHPIGYGGVPYVLLKTLLSLDPATETNPHLLTLAKIWKKKSVIPDELGKEVYTLDHLGFGPHPIDYENGTAKHPNDRVQKLPNGFVYDPDVRPKRVWFVKTRLKMMRDGVIGSVIKSLNPNYTPKLRKLAVLARGKVRNKLYGDDIDYEDAQQLQEAPPVDAVFFSCSGCHQGRVIVGGEMDDSGNIKQAGQMKFMPGMPNTEIEAQYFSKLLMLTGLALIESGFSLESDSLPESADQITPSRDAVLALFTRMLTQAIDNNKVKTIYGASRKEIARARYQTYAVARDFPTYIGELIGVAIKTQYIYYQVANKYAFNADNSNRKSPEQKVPDVINDRVGQMDAFGVASGLVAIHTLRKDNSYLKFIQKDNPDNPILAGIDGVDWFSGRVDLDQAGQRIRDNIENWAPNVPAPIDIKSLNWSGHRELANWDGNQGASARTLASGVSATGDPLKVNVRIHQPLNPLIEHMPPPPYPFDIDADKARRGMEIFNGNGITKKEACAGCHQPNLDRIFSVAKLGVDANRSLVNTDVSRYGLAALVMEACQIFIRKNPDNDWCLPRDKNKQLITDWYESTDDYFKDTPGRVRDEKNGYKVDMLHGIWARAPYLHNGSVPTLMHMLCPQTRPQEFNRGVLFYDQEEVGFEWTVTPKQRYSEYEVMQVKKYNTGEFGRSNQGHNYGSSLCPNTKGLDPITDRKEIKDRILNSKIGDLLEYLKTL